MKIILHTDKCITCGSCVAVAPDLFSIDSGIVSLKKNPEKYSGEDKKKAHQAASICPNEVITIIEE